MATVKENLIAAKALIDTPEKWIKGGLRSADCFCAMGAVGHIRTKGGWISETDEYQALADAVPDVFQRSVPNFNDDATTTHDDIMALFDRAIAAADPS